MKSKKPEMGRIQINAAEPSFFMVGVKDLKELLDSGLNVMVGYYEDETGTWQRIKLEDLKPPKPKRDRGTK